MVPVDEALRTIRDAWASNGDTLDDLKERLTGAHPIPLVPFVGAGRLSPWPRHSAQQPRGHAELS